MDDRVVGHRLDGVDEETIRTAIRRSLEKLRVEIEPEADLVVIPDAHYPYHPTTGLVTNPDLVRAVVAELDSWHSGSISIAGASEEFDWVEQIAEFLDYTQIAADVGVELVDLRLSDTVTRRLPDRAPVAEVSLPRPMAEGTIINLPTLCVDASGTRISVVANLARPMARTEEPVDHSDTVSQVCPPGLTILDGTFVYTGRPQRAEFVLSAVDPAPIDLVVREVLGLTATKAPIPHGGDGEVTLDLDGGTVADLEVSAPDGDEAEPVLPERSMARAYRLYARLCGDAVPPQFLRSGGLG